jgi:hypothetical protein
MEEELRKRDEKMAKIEREYSERYQEVKEKLDKT